MSFVRNQILDLSVVDVAILWKIVKNYPLTSYWNTGFIVLQTITTRQKKWLTQCTISCICKSNNTTSRSRPYRWGADGDTLQRGWRTRMATPKQIMAELWHQSSGQPGPSQLSSAEAHTFGMPPKTLITISSKAVTICLLWCQNQALYLRCNIH